MTHDDNQRNPLVDQIIRERGKEHLTGNARKNYRREVKRQLNGSHSTTARQIAKYWMASLLEIQNNRCAGCNRLFTYKMPPTLDHIRPLARGGEHARHNVQALCAPCNNEKADT